MLSGVDSGTEASSSLQTATRNYLRSCMSRSYKFHDPEGTYFLTLPQVFPAQP